MSNPLYADDPDFYERPGETVHLITDVNPARVVVPALPWQGKDHDEPSRIGHEQALFGTRYCSPLGERPCVICSRPYRSPGSMCPYCARAQAADETHKARAKQPQPSQPRISIREGWEVWSSSQPDETPEFRIREHETRIG